MVEVDEGESSEPIVDEDDNVDDLDVLVLFTKPLMLLTIVVLSCLKKTWVH